MFKALYLQRHKLIMFDTLDLVSGYCLSSFIMTVISLTTFLIHFIILFSPVLPLESSLFVDSVICLNFLCTARIADRTIVSFIRDIPSSYHFNGIYRPFLHNNGQSQ